MTSEAPKPAVALGPYFPPSTRVVGKDVQPNATLILYGPSGAGKSHTGLQLLDDPDIGKDKVLFLVNEDVTSIYGEGAHFVTVDRFETAQAVVRDLLSQHRAGRALPPFFFTDSISGLAHGTQAYFREHPIEQINKQGELARNKFAEFGELGTGMIDFMLLYAQLPGVKVALCTTYENPTKPGAQPELAVEGSMIPKFLTQLSTCALYIKPQAVAFPREAVEAAKAKGTLYQSHRIVVPWQGTDATVNAIERYAYSQGGGEVLAKGHRNLAVREKADLPMLIRKIMGKEARG